MKAEGELTKLLLLQSQARVALLDQLLEMVYRLRPLGVHELLASGRSRLNLGSIFTVRILNLAQEFLLVLRRRLVTCQTELATLLLAGADTVVLLRQRLIFGLGLLGQGLGVGDLLFRRQSRLFPLLATTFDSRRELEQIVRHLLQGYGELQAMVGHTLLQSMNILVTGAVGALAVLVSVRGFLDSAGQLPQPLSMFLLQ